MPWFIKTEDGERGPVPSKDLLKLARSGQLEETDLVRRTDNPKWAPARKVKGLFHGPIPIANTSSLPTIAESENMPANQDEEAVIADIPEDVDASGILEAEIIPDDEPDALPEVQNIQDMQELPVAQELPEVQQAQELPEIEEFPDFQEDEYHPDAEESENNPLAALAGAAGEEVEGHVEGAAFNEGYAEQIYDQPEDDAVAFDDVYEEEAEEADFPEAGYQEAEVFVAEDEQIEELGTEEDYEEAIDGFDDPRGAISGFNMEDEEEEPAVISDDDNGHYDHEAWDELERAPQPTGSGRDPDQTRATRGSKGKRKSKGAGKDRRQIAIVLFWITSVLYLLGVPLSLIGAMGSESGDEPGAKAFIWGMAALMSFFCLLFGVLGIVIARGIKHGKEWARITGIVLFALNIPSIFILFAILGMWSLLAKGSVEAMQLAAAEYEEKKASKGQRGGKRKKATRKKVTASKRSPQRSRR